MSGKSTKAKARPKFPLWLHPTGQWACKRRGRYFYFGKDKDSALTEFLRVKDDIEAGRPIRSGGRPGDRLTLRDLCNHFMTAKETALRGREISQRTYQDYHSTCKRLIAHYGPGLVVEELRPADLLSLKGKWASLWGVHMLGNEITRARVIFNFGYAHALLDKPVRFGDFKRPAKAAYRRRRAEVGPRLFEPLQIRTMLEHAKPQLKTMILLACNAAFGNHDCASLPISAIDLKTGWLDFARPKTGVERRVPLWPETIEAIRSVLAARKSPKNEEHDTLLFVTKRGGPWNPENEKARQSPLSQEFRKLLNKLGMYRKGLSFYTLRHCFQTVADETGDGAAIRRVMGHADSSISDLYRERFPDDRLRRVVEHVRAWLFNSGESV